MSFTALLHKLYIIILYSLQLTRGNNCGCVKLFSNAHLEQSAGLAVDHLLTQEADNAYHIKSTLLVEQLFT